MDLTISVYIFCLVTVFIAIFVRTLTGIGGALVIVTLLSFVLPFKFVVGVDTLIETIVLASMVGFLEKNIKIKEITPLFIGAFVGTVIGFIFLKSVSEQILRQLLGVIILVSILFLIIEQKKHLKFSKKLGLLFGFIGGSFGSVVASSSPSFAVFLSGRINTKDSLRASILSLVFATSAFRTVIFTVGGIITIDTIILILLLFPSVIFAMILSSKMVKKISVTFLKQAIITIIFLLGIGLLFV